MTTCIVAHTVLVVIPCVCSERCIVKSNRGRWLMMMIQGRWCSSCGCWCWVISVLRQNRTSVKVIGNLISRRPSHMFCVSHSFNTISKFNIPSLRTLIYWGESKRTITSASTSISTFEFGSEIFIYIGYLLPSLHLASDQIRSQHLHSLLILYRNVFNIS
jgi:hypothetical protein